MIGYDSAVKKRASPAAAAPHTDRCHIAYVCTFRCSRIMYYTSHDYAKIPWSMTINPETLLWRFETLGVALNYLAEMILSCSGRVVYNKTMK